MAQQKTHSSSTLLINSQRPAVRGGDRCPLICLRRVAASSGSRARRHRHLAAHSTGVRVLPRSPRDAPAPRRVPTRPAAQESGSAADGRCASRSTAVARAAPRARPAPHHTCAARQLTRWPTARIFRPRSWPRSRSARSSSSPSSSHSSRIRRPRTPPAPSALALALCSRRRPCPLPALSRPPPSPSALRPQP